MDDVASEPGPSKGALYLDFQSKDHLIDALVTRLMDVETRRPAEIRSSGGSAAHRQADGVEAGECRTVDPDVLAVSLAGQVEGPALLWLLDRERLRIGETARESVRLALAGLRPDSARAPGPP